MSHLGGTGAKVLAKPFAEWPSELRMAFLEGWTVTKLGVGKGERAVIESGGKGVGGILAGAAWNLGATEAREK